MFTNLTVREKVLLLTAAMVSVVIGYYFGRYAGKARAVAAVEKAAEEADRQFEKKKEELVEATQQPLAVEEVSDLEQRLESFQQQLEQEQLRLAKLRPASGPAADGPGLQQQKVEIAELAEEVGVRIVDSATYHPPDADRDAQRAESMTAGHLLPADLLYELSGERLQQMTIECSFPELRQFLTELNRRPGQITVVHFDIRVAERGQEEDKQTLETKLVLAL